MGMFLHELGSSKTPKICQWSPKSLIALAGISTRGLFQPCSVALQSLLVSRYVEIHQLLYPNPVLSFSHMYKEDTSIRQGI